MKKIIMALVLLGSTTAIGQVNNVEDFKEHDDGAYIKSYIDAVEAMHKYNYVMSANGTDTTKMHYDITNNPIDFGYIKKSKERVIITMLLRVDSEYHVYFKEIDNEDTELFTVENAQGEEVLLTYKKGHKR
jgi:hypothetical protein